MPWQPFRRKVKHKLLQNAEMETSFDDLLPRSASDGNLVRASSERFLLSSFAPGRSYGTCTGSSGLWTSFISHTVEQGDTLPGLALRYNITVQDLKLANKLWTNEGLWPGRELKIPVAEASTTSLDLSGSSGCSDTMSTGSSSGASSRRLSSHDSLLANSGQNSAVNSPYTKPSTSSSSSPLCKQGVPPCVRRASVEDLQDFLSKMDTNIASNKRATTALIKKSSLSSEEKQTLQRDSGVNFSNNNSKHNSSNIC